MRKQPIFTLCLLSAAMFSQTSLAATFCGDRSNIFYTGDEIIQGSIGADDCYEIGAKIDGSADDYVSHAKNMDILAGAKMNVLGIFTDSTIHGKAEVWIGKTPRIAVEGYIEGEPALGDNIIIESEGLVRVMDGGTLQNSFLNGGKVYISNTGTADDPGRSINNTVNDKGMLYVFDGGLSENTTIKANGMEFVQTKGISNNARIEAGAEQRVISSGVANNAENYGLQRLYKTTATAGIANNTVSLGQGQQYVQGGAVANNSTFKNSAFQWVDEQSSSVNTNFYNNASSQIEAGGQLLGITNLNDNSALYFVSGQNSAYAENVQLHQQNNIYIVSGVDKGLVNFGLVEGGGNILFNKNNKGFSQLNIDELKGDFNFLLSSTIADGEGDYINITKSNGTHRVIVQDSGKEITRPDIQTLDLINDKNAGSTFQLANLTGTNIVSVDGGTYMYSLHERDNNGGKIWYLAAEGRGTETPTTPSTDAVVSMATASNLIFNNELNNLRFRHGDLKNRDGAGGVWLRKINNEDHVSSGVANYELTQSGVEGGVDKIMQLEAGKAFVGVTASYGDSEVKHKRGGESSIHHFSVGGYFTYFSDANWYFDSVLKYSKFNTHVSAVTTNQALAKGRYTQHGLGTAFELGYLFEQSSHFWAEPYVRLSYANFSNEKYQLNNGMKVNVRDQQSLISEVGTSLGKKFTLANSVEISPYIKLAVEHEFFDSNNVKINNVNKIDSNLSGTRSRYGIGADVKFNKNFNVFSEVNYRKGSKIESPIQANLGVRFTF